MGAMGTIFAWPLGAVGVLFVATAGAGGGLGLGVIVALSLQRRRQFR